MVPAPGFCDNQESKSYIEEDVGVGLCVTVSAKIMLHCIIDETTFPPADVVWSIKGKFCLTRKFVRIEFFIKWCLVG